MKKMEYVYRELLFQAIEKGNFEFKQSELAEQLKVSLTNVNHALQIPKKMSAVRIRRNGFTLVNPKKLLYYWATIRNPEKDIIYKTSTKESALQIEKEMPSGIMFGAYSAYRFRFNSAPADYSEVYVYAEDEALNEIRRRFPEKRGAERLLVLQPDPLLKKYGTIPPIAQIFADLWNLPHWYAKDFLDEMGKKIDILLQEGAEK